MAVLGPSGGKARGGCQARGTTTCLLGQQSALDICLLCAGRSGFSGCYVLAEPEALKRRTAMAETRIEVRKECVVGLRRRRCADGTSTRRASRRARDEQVWATRPEGLSPPPGRMSSFHHVSTRASPGEGIHHRCVWSNAVLSRIVGGHIHHTQTQPTCEILAAGYLILPLGMWRYGSYCYPRASASEASSHNRHQRFVAHISLMARNRTGSPVLLCIAPSALVDPFGLVAIACAPSLRWFV